MFSHNLTKPSIFRHRTDRLNEMYKKKIFISTSWSSKDLLSEKREKYTHLDKETNRLLLYAFNLRESFINGAQSSIKESKRISDLASETISKCDNEIDQSFRDIINNVKQKLNESKEIIENNNKNLKQYLNKTTEINQLAKVNLMQLNLLVCGSLDLDCSNVCGGPDCDGKCGYLNNNQTDNQTCSSGLETSFLKFNYLKNSFKNEYENKQNILKKYLTKVISLTRIFVSKFLILLKFL